MARQLRQTEIGLDPLEHTHGSLLRIELIGLFQGICPALLRIAPRHLKELGPVATLGYCERDPGKLRIGHLTHYHLIAHRAETGGDLAYRIAQQHIRRLIHRPVILQRDRAHHSAASHMNMVDINIPAAVVRHPEHIHAGKHLTHYHRL